jgi:hypothetical protein
MAETEWYSTLLADTKVVLAPRGTNLETFRLYEGLRAGCVVVCDLLPDRPYLHGAPIIELGRWSRLEEVVVPLLRDPARLTELSAAGRRFWDERLSEPAVGRGIADVLNAIR